MEQRGKTERGGLPSWGQVVWGAVPNSADEDRFRWSIGAGKPAEVRNNDVGDEFEAVAASEKDDIDKVAAEDVAVDDGGLAQEQGMEHGDRHERRIAQTHSFVEVLRGYTLGGPEHCNVKEAGEATQTGESAALPETRLSQSDFSLANKILAGWDILEERRKRKVLQLVTTASCASQRHRFDQDDAIGSSSGMAACGEVSKLEPGEPQQHVEQLASPRHHLSHAPTPKKLALLSPPASSSRR